jgi:hypothetical protein
MIVTIPLNWWHNDSKRSIDGFLGLGIYDKHGHFDPNNQAKISLPWTVKDTTAIFNING